MLTYFYIPYALAAIPTSLVAKRFHAGNVIPILMFVWGAFATGAGGSRNYTDLVAMRTCIGLAEAGFKPCVMYYFSTFYTRKEIGMRMSLWGVTGFIAVIRVSPLFPESLKLTYLHEGCSQWTYLLGCLSMDWSTSSRKPKLENAYCF